MRKVTSNFLGRKNQSLFDTTIKRQDMDNQDFVLHSSVITDSGTASVRARPTVKHYASSDNFQGFAVPTPKVPLLPPLNGPKVNGSVGGDQLSNGSVLSVPDLVEGEIFVPPHPSVAPPPPPGAFILPPPDFMGDLNSLQPAIPQKPSLRAPGPASLSQTVVYENLSQFKPPSMAPPKIPSTGPASPTHISSPTSGNAPQRPTFAPPAPPKALKNPPPKPIRWSSVPSLDSPPHTPAPPPPVQTPTMSTFNPQSTAKIYNAPKQSVLNGNEDRDPKPKQMLLLEDSRHAKSVPAPVPAPAQVDGKEPEVVLPSKPAFRDTQELKENLRITRPSKSPLSAVRKEGKTQPVDISQLLHPPPRSAQTLKANGSLSNLGSSKDKEEGSLNHNLTYSPLLDRKLRNLKGSETNEKGSATSPLSLLMAAKEREKQRVVHSPSHEDSLYRNDQLNAGFHPSDSSSNHFSVTPRSGSSLSQTSNEERLHQSPMSARSVEQKNQTPVTYDTPALVKSPKPSTSPALGTISTHPSATVSNLLKQKDYAKETPSKPQSVLTKEGLNVPVLPPPPEFGDFGEFMEPPPSIRPPNPPVKKEIMPAVIPIPPAPAPPPAPKVVPPPPPKLPPPDFNVRPKPNIQKTPKVTPNHLPSNLSPSQVTLLSILQKKMLEMDHTMAPMKETESNSDDWGSPFTDEKDKIPVSPRVTPQIQNYPVVNKAATLNMKELESKMARKEPGASSVKLPSTSDRPQQQSKHQYGMTFTVRPGTRNPITIVRRGDP